jgi:tetratricopeptide (TPR) repeat protein
MGQTAYKAREFDRAEKIYNQSGSKLNNSKKAKTYHNIGNSRMQQKNYQGAIDAYKESLKNNPNDKETRYNLSEAIRRLKDQQKKNNKDNKDNKKNKDQQKNQNKNNQNKNKDKNQQNSNNKNNQSNSNKNNQQNKSKLPNKAVDRMLDQLAKKEAETKKKTTSRKGDNLGTVSGKDW